MWISIAAYLAAMEILKEEETTLAVSAKQRDQETKLRQSRYLNNIVEQDHRATKRIVKLMMGFKSFSSARKTLSGIEVMNMMRKGQVKDVERGNVIAQAAFVCQIFGVVA